MPAGILIFWILLAKSSLFEMNHEYTLYTRGD